MLHPFVRSISKWSFATALPFMLLICNLDDLVRNQDTTRFSLSAGSDFTVTMKASDSHVLDLTAGSAGWHEITIESSDGPISVKVERVLATGNLFAIRPTANLNHPN